VILIGPSLSLARGLFPA